MSRLFPVYGHISKAFHRSVDYPPGSDVAAAADMPDRTVGRGVVTCTCRLRGLSCVSLVDAVQGGSHDHGEFLLLHGLVDVFEYAETMRPEIVF